MLEIQTDETQFASGPGIAIAEMETVRSYNPNWSTDTPADVVENFMYDDRKPTLFYSYPPATTNSYVELIYVKNPADCASRASTLGIPDSYANALLYYMLMRAAEKAQKFDAAGWARKQYFEALQARALNDAKGSLNSRNVGGGERQN